MILGNNIIKKALAIILYFKIVENNILEKNLVKLSKIIQIILQKFL